MKIEFDQIALLTVLFLALFGSAEILHHFFKVQAEYTRKYVHFFTGLLTLFFPVMFSSHWSVMIICTAFLTLLIICLKYKFLKSINAVNRFTLGSVIYPIIIYISFLVYSMHQTELFDKPYIWFYLPVMIMATADPLAAIAGQKWSVKKYNIGNETKSFLGSFVFFITALLISLILFYLLYPQKNIGLTIIASLFLISLVSTITEAFSKNGLDNFTIPLSVLIAMELINCKFYIFN